MVHVSRRAAAVSVRVAAVLVAGAVALPIPRRRLRGSSGKGPGQGNSSPATEIPDANPAGSASGLTDDGHVNNEAAADDPDQVERGGVPVPLGRSGTNKQGPYREIGRVQVGGADVGIQLEPGPDPSRVTRARAWARRCLTAAWAYTRTGFTAAWAYTRGGFKPAVWVLLALTVATLAYGWVNRPDTTIPQPPTSSIEVDFSAGHHALFPVTVGVRLLRYASFPGSGGASTVRLAIDLSGEDFTHAGWQVHADVPTGVDVIEPQNNPHPYTSDGTTYVDIAPGPQPRGAYTALLEWKDLTSGPLQVIRANLVAALPSVTVTNETNNDQTAVPEPSVTVNRVLEPGGDFTYQAGFPPDQFVGVEWQWSPVIGKVNGQQVVDVLDVEAKSAALDGPDQTAQFYSGIAFGLAASAFIAGVVEFVKAERRRQNPGPGASARADTAAHPKMTQQPQGWSLGRGNALVP
jgi:hypothetical protein